LCSGEKNFWGFHTYIWAWNPCSRPILAQKAGIALGAGWISGGIGSAGAAVGFSHTFETLSEHRSWMITLHQIQPRHKAVDLGHGVTAIGSIPILH
jgi:hypothetical protein